MKVIDDYDYIYNVIDYDYNASGNGYYDYLRSCNRLHTITITPNLVHIAFIIKQSLVSKSRV